MYVPCIVYAETACVVDVCVAAVYAEAILLVFTI